MTKWLFICVLSGTWSFGQDLILASTTTKPVQLKEGFELRTPKNDHQYVSVQWAKGNLYYANGTSKTYDSLNFDKYGNKIDVIIHNKPLSILPLGLAGALIYETPTSGYVIIEGAIEEGRKFLLVNSVGDFTLVSYTSINEVIPIEFHKVDEIRFVPKAENRLIVSSRFYIWKGMTWEPFKLTKSVIGKLFSLNKKEIQTIFLEHAITTQDEQGLVYLFHLLNSHEY